MEIFAHRGYSAKYPENTMAAFKAALQHPVDGIEFDVHMTKDGHVVVMHDEKVDRTTNGKGYIKDMTLEQLKKLDAGSYFHPLFKGEKVPTLEEVLELFELSNVQINIELKTDVFPYYGMEMKVVQLIEKFGLTERVIISSFDHEVLTRVKQVAPNIKLAALFTDIIINPWQYTKSIGADAMHVSGYIMLRPSAMNALKEGASIRVYTINEIEHMEMLAKANVQGFFTDEVEKAMEWKKAK